MQEMVELNNVEELRSYLVRLFAGNFSENDIVIDEEEADDERTGWHHTHYVCVKRFGKAIYSYPQCIGMVDLG
jgi:hypothetical protein